jgi:hypothetical protein
MVLYVSRQRVQIDVSAAQMTGHTRVIHMVDTLKQQDYNKERCGM